MQIAILKSEVGVLRDTRNDVLSSANTALTVVLGLSVLLVGYNWFTANRAYERDRKAMHQELENDVVSRIQEVATETRATLSAELKTSNDLNRSEMKAAVTAELTDTRNKLAAAVSEVRGLRSELVDLRIQETIADARYWELRKVPGNELTRWIRLLELLVGSKRDGIVLAEALTNIARLGRDGVLPFWSYVPGLNATLDKLGPQYQTEVSEIRTLLQRVPRGERPNER